MPDKSRIPTWLIVIVCVGALLNIVGAVVSLADPGLLLGSGDQVTNAVRVYAGYLFSRDLALAVVLLGALVLRRWRLLAALMLLTALVQIFDIALDAVTGRWALLPGLLVFVVAFGLGAARLGRATVTTAVSG